MTILQGKSHHFAGLISLFVGISFLLERYLLVSPALIGPVALMSWVPGPLTPIQTWGLLFVFGGIFILVSWTPLIRAIFLSLGMASWALFAATSLYQSLLGDQANSTGSFLGIVLTGLVFRFYIAIRDVVRDFTSRKHRGTIDA